MEPEKTVLRRHLLNPVIILWNTIDADTRVVVSTLGGLTIMLVVGALFSGLTNAVLVGDRSLQAYCSQTIVRGEGPYGGYILMHPPLAFLPGAAAIRLGSFLGFDDVLSIRYFVLAESVISVWLAYLVAKELSNDSSAGVLAAAAIGWNMILWLIAGGEQIKLTLLPLMLLTIWLGQRRRWGWAGIAVGCVVFTWAGAFIFVPVVYAAALLQSQESRVKALRAISGGLLAVSLVMVVYLALEGTLPNLFQQYFLTIYRYGTNKLSGQGIYAQGIGFAHVYKHTRLSPADTAILVLGIIGLFAYVGHKWRAGHSPWAALSSPSGSMIVLMGLMSGAQGYVDFQTQLDFVPLLPALAPMSGWLVWQIILLWQRMWSDRSTGRSLSVYTLLLIVALSSARLLNPKIFWAGLSNQRLGAAWIQTTLDHDKSIQALGNLAPLVLTERQNHTRVIHLGPKSLIAMESEGQSLAQFEEDLSRIQPSLILMDTRNHSKDYLWPLIERLQDDYNYLGEYGGSGFTYSREGDTNAHLAGLGLTYSHDWPRLMEADLLATQGLTKEVVSSYRKAAGSYGTQAEPLIFLGDLYLEHGEDDLARTAYELATQRPGGSEWAYLAISRYWWLKSGTPLEASLRARERAQKALAEAFDGELASSSTNTLPRLVSPIHVSEEMEFPLSIGVPVNTGIGGKVTLLGYSIESARVIAARPPRLTLFWWSPVSGLRRGRLTASWVAGQNNSIEDAFDQEIRLHPGYVVAWTYEISVPEEITRDDQMHLQICLSNDAVASENSPCEYPIYLTDGILPISYR